MCVTHMHTFYKNNNEISRNKERKKAFLLIASMESQENHVKLALDNLTCPMSDRDWQN